MMLSPAARAITALLIVPGFSRATGQAAIPGLTYPSKR